MTQNRDTAIRGDALLSEYRDFKLSFEYGYFTAIHKDYDCDWQGDEDGWVGSHPLLSARSCDDLIGEIDCWYLDQADEVAA